jgi:hypothetical protein
MLHENRREQAWVRDDGPRYVGGARREDLMSVDARGWKRLKPRLLGATIAIALALTRCTTFVRPTTCTPGSTSCGNLSDARFCEYVARSVAGHDCAALGLFESARFCVVRAGGCTDTTYAVRQRDCQVVEYERLRDSARSDCPPGTPTFTSR